MPLPFIPVVVALGAVAAGGTIAGALGVRDKKKSNELNEMAQLTVSNAEELLKNASETTQDTIGKLGKIKLKLWSSQVNEFINYYSLINNVNQEFSENKSNVAFGLSEDEFRNISRTASSFSEIASMGLTTLGTGALAGLGAFSGVMLFGTASTGTAISTLTGIAATNATLAWLGGGTLAAGGLGIAGGIAILGGIVAAPIFAIGGTLFAISAKNNLRQAEQNIEKANDIKSEMQDAIERQWPGLTRPVYFCYRKYNQDLTTGSLLIELGSHGNTLEEILYTAQLAGESIGSYLEGLKVKE